MSPSKHNILTWNIFTIFNEYVSFFSLPLRLRCCSVSKITSCLMRHFQQVLPVDNKPIKRQISTLPCSLRQRAYTMNVKMEITKKEIEMKSKYSEQCDEIRQKKKKEPERVGWSSKLTPYSQFERILCMGINMTKHCQHKKTATTRPINLFLLPRNGFDVYHKSCVVIFARFTSTSSIKLLHSYLYMWYVCASQTQRHIPGKKQILEKRIYQDVHCCEARVKSERETGRGNGMGDVHTKKWHERTTEQ